jgi:uncharacterized Zn finger protein (UPF0148 family)
MKSKSDDLVQLRADREEAEKEVERSAQLKGNFPKTTMSSKRRMDNLSQSIQGEGSQERVQSTLDDYAKVKMFKKFKNSLTEFLLF